MGRLKGSPTWTIDQKAHAVAVLQTEANGCFIEAERLTDISRVTIAQAANNPQIAEIAEIKKADIANGFKSLTSKLLARYETLVDSANLDNKGTTLLGIAADKALLYSNEPTQISANVNVSVDLAEIRRKRPDLSDEEVEVFARAKERRLKELLGGG